MVDGTKVQIGNDVLLDVGVNSDWYISSVGYSYDPKEVTISLRKKETERSRLDIIREIIEDKADVESVVRGKWVNAIGQPISDNHSVYCSVCGQWSEYRGNYCLWCGADMRSRITGKHADIMIIDESVNMGGKSNTDEN